MACKKCTTEIPEQEPFGNVVSCNCGTITINYGNASVRIPGDIFSSFVEMMGKALTKHAEKNRHPRLVSIGESLN